MQISVRFVRLVFYFLCSGLVICALSQNASFQQAVELYQAANNDYNKALELSKKKESNDTQIDALNHLALNRFTLFLQAAPKNLPQFDSLRYFALLKAGELEHYFDSLSNALNCYKTAIALKKKLPALNDSFLFKPNMFVGLIYTNQDKLDSAKIFLKEAEAIQARTPEKLEESERLYNILGGIYYEYGNFRQAKNYFLKAAERLSPTNPSYQALRVNYKLNLAGALQKLEDYKAASDIYQALLREEASYKNEIYNHLGLIQMHAGATDQAIASLKRVQYDNHLSIGLNNDIANAFLNLKAFDSAKKYLSLAVIKNSLYNPSSLSIDYGRTLKTSGDLQNQTGQPIAALRYYQQALHHFYPSFNDTAITANPVKFSGAFSYINLFQTLVAKAETQDTLYHQTKKIDWAKQSLETYQAAFSLIEYVERTYESDEARLFLTKIKQAVHDKPINLAFGLYQQTGDKKYLSLLYRFDQQNKATVLALNRQLNTTAASSASPLLQKEMEIKSEITRLSIKASQITDSAQVARLNSSIRDYEIELGKLQESISSNEATSESNIPLLHSLQSSLLDPRTVLVSYHLSSEKLTTLVVTKESLNCYQQPLPKAFDSLVQHQVLAIKTPTVKPVSTLDTALYGLLLRGVPLSGMEQLIVIPDDVLAYLPFESLQANNGRFLIQQVAVQYQFSTALLDKNETDFSKTQTLAFAPFDRRAYNTALPVLPASKQEIAGTKGRSFFDTVATKEKFLQYCDSFPIVHLATHAVANNSADNLSYVVFAPGNNREDNRLYAGEIYNLRLRKTGLVILSACETGAGSLVKGEGVLSLSRAFSYAGCPNVITSLWKANDFSTAYLTTRIHRYLSEGQSISKALQTAKMDYLSDKSINPRLKQPYYWSHLVFVGNYSPEKSVPWFWFAVAGSVLCVILLYAIKSRKAGL